MTQDTGTQDTGTQNTGTENDLTRPGGLTGMRAVDIARAVRERRVTPEEVIRAHLDRIAAAEPLIRAFQAVRAEAALADAEALGRRDDLGSLPLAGVPVAIKDNVDVAGLPTRHGSAATSSAPAGQDDELVRRLRQAGAIPIGKTQMPELAIWPFTEPAAFPATRNPWDLSRTPGGSPAAAPRRSRPGWPRWRSAPTAVAPSGSPPRAAGSSA